MPKTKYCENCHSMDVYHVCPVCKVYLCSRCSCPRHFLLGVVTPSLVGYSNDELATAWNIQRKTLIDAEGYFWVFYYYGFLDLDNPFPFLAYSSQDGKKWSNPQIAISTIAEESNTYPIASYSSGDDSFETIYGSKICAQTLKATQSYYVYRVRARLYRVGNPGTVFVQLRTLDGEGKPTNTILCQRKADGNSFTTSTSGTLYSFLMAPLVQVTNGTSYAIVISAPEGDENNYICWRLDASSPTYADGQFAISTDNGSSWNLVPANDGMFTIDGGPFRKILLGQNLDVFLSPSVNRILTLIPQGDRNYWARWRSSKGVLTREALRCWSSTVNHNTVCTRASETKNFWVCKGNAFHPEIGSKRADANIKQRKDWVDYSISGSTYSSSAWGGYSTKYGQSLTFSFYQNQALYITVKSDGTLGWGWLTDNYTGISMTHPPVELDSQLGSDADYKWSVLTGCSERELTDFQSGYVDIVFKNSSGHLVHRRFDGTSWSPERIIEENTTCEYPVLVASKNDIRFLFYFKNSKLYIRMFKKGKWLPEREILKNHTFNNPKWLSSNQVIQLGHICLVWTEESGTTPPYAVWFSAIRVGTRSEILKPPPVFEWLVA